MILLTHWAYIYSSSLFKISLITQDLNKAYHHYAAHYTRFMFTYIKVGYDYITDFHRRSKISIGIQRLISV